MAEIIVTLQGQETERVPVTDKEIYIGRSEGSHIHLKNLSVSRTHAAIRKEGGRYIVVDLDSSNGVFVNGQRVTRSPIFNGDRIQIGKHELYVDAPDFTPENQSLEDLQQTVVLSPASSDAGGKEVGEPAYVSAIFTVHSTNHPRGSKIPITRGETIIGRGPDCDVRVLDWFVMPEQAKLRSDGHQVFISDLSGQGALLLNGESIEGEKLLRAGDVIKMGVSRAAWDMDGEQQDAPAVPQPEPEDQEIPVMGAMPEWEENSEVAESVNLMETGQGEPEEEADDLALNELEDAPEIEPAPVELDEDFFEEEDLPADTEEPEDVLIEGIAETEEPSPEEPALSEEADVQLEAMEAVEPMDEALEPEIDVQPEPLEEALEDEEEEEEDFSLPDEAFEPEIDVQPESLEEALEDEEEEVSSPADPEEAPEYLETEAAEEPAAEADEEPEEETPPTANERAVAMWEKALKNPSLAVRKQAAAQLKKLTGQDYDVG